MPENDPNLEWGIWEVDVSSVNIPLEQGNQEVPLEQGIQEISLEQGLQNINQIESPIWDALWNTSDVLGSQDQNLDFSSTIPVGDVSNDVGWPSLDWGDISTEIGEIDSAKIDLGIQNSEENNGSTIDESLFVETWDTSQTKSHSGWGRFGKYLRLFFFSSVLIILWVVAIVLLYLFDRYITEASKPVVDVKQQGFVDGFKDKLKSVKWFFWMDATNNYQTPWVQDDLSVVNGIIDSRDLNYIEKKDILSPYVAELIRDAETKARRVEDLKHDIARQWFLPGELDGILSKDQAIDTIQRSLNALEVIKFSTAAKVYSYMDSALQTISEMVRVNWSSPEAIRKLFAQLNNRWEKDISSYVYMCYLNPFETRAGCDDIWDLDMYYQDLEKQEKRKSDENPDYKKLDMIDIKLFKNAMGAIDQLLETDQTALFSITFNWFNAQDKNITFNIEVYTNQNDEKTLMEQWKKNPNIFILTSIVNLLKQSSFVIGAEITTKTVNVEVRNVDYGWFSMPVNYSSQEFTVPIQKNTEREIFDYIDLDSIIEKLYGDKEDDSEDLSDAEVENVNDDNDSEDVDIDEDLLEDEIEDLDDDSENSDLDEELWEDEEVLLEDEELLKSNESLSGWQKNLSGEQSSRNQKSASKNEVSGGAL